MSTKSVQGNRNLVSREYPGKVLFKPRLIRDLFTGVHFPLESSIQESLIIEHCATVSNKKKKVLGPFGKSSDKFNTGLAIPALSVTSSHCPPLEEFTDLAADRVPWRDT